MSLTIAGITFEHAHYDPRGDVLYLSVEGYKGPPPWALCTPEGHNVEWDESGRVIAMTLVNVRWLLEREGDLTITVPIEHMTAEQLAAFPSPAPHVTEAQLAPVLAAA